MTTAYYRLQAEAKTDLDGHWHWQTHVMSIVISSPFTKVQVGTLVTIQLFTDRLQCSKQIKGSVVFLFASLCPGQWLWTERRANSSSPYLGQISRSRSYVEIRGQSMKSVPLSATDVRYDIMTYFWLSTSLLQSGRCDL